MRGTLGWRIIIALLSVSIVSGGTAVRPAPAAAQDPRLQAAIDQGLPIRDVSPGQGGGFLDRGRQLLPDNGWTFDSSIGMWSP